MAWRRLTVTVEQAVLERLTDALLDAGAVSVDVSDADAGSAEERATFAEPGSEPPAWNRNRLSVLFPQDRDAHAAYAAACAAAQCAPCPQPELDEVAEQDWVRLTQSQFGPIRISPRLWIVPSWETAPDPDAINLRLDPGAAFGTGTHPTTRLCLRWLDRNIRGGESVLDYGCGSGILAIAALKLGAARARGVDIDPQAIVAARANAVQNQVSAVFHEPRGTPEAGCEIVLANILANPLIALAPLLAAAVMPGGRIVLCGVLETQAAEVGAAYRPWIDLTTTAVDEGWALLAGRRR